MKFLHGVGLTKALKHLTAKRGPLKISIAYWGTGGLKLLGLNPRRKNLRIVCCLKGGKSDPDIIKQFGKQARQNDRLHAKVIWTPRNAIVSSANASSNGMPEEELMSSGLIEAGLSTTDSAELAAIESWFEGLYSKSVSISKTHLNDARIARQKREWGRPESRKRRPLLEALKEGPVEFKKQRIFFVFWKEQPTSTQINAAKSSVRQNRSKIALDYKLSNYQIDKLDYYFNWHEIPVDAFLIDVEMKRKKWRIAGVWKSQPSKKQWPVRTEGGIDYLTFVYPATQTFPYLITSEDKKHIHGIIGKIWTKAKGDASSRIISLKDSATILLGRG